MNARASAPSAEELLHSSRAIRWWPATLALLVIGILYALMTSELTIGTQYGVLAVGVLALVGATGMRWRGMIGQGRLVVMAGLALITIAVTVSAVYLVQALLKHTTESGALLRDAGLLWVGNVLTFALWYWEIDGGGPAHRHATRKGSTDFAFPQAILGDEQKPKDWLPDFLDYVFLAFNTSTAFSPTDTMVLARRAKVLMMCQSLISLVTIAVLAARAINTI